MQFAGQKTKDSHHSPFEDPIPPEWKTPLILSIAIHLAVFLAVTINLSFFTKPKELDTYTVTLFSVEEDAKPPAPGPPKAEVQRSEPAPAAMPKAKVEPPPPPPKAKAEPVPPTPPPQPPPKVMVEPPKQPVPVPIEPPRETPPVTPKNIVSLEPAKTKVKKEPEKIKKEIIEDRIKVLEEKVHKETMEEKLKRSLQRLNTQVTAEKTAEKAKEEEARQVSNALDTLKKALEITKPSAGPTTSASAGNTAAGAGGIRGEGAGKSGKALSEAKRRYYAELVTHIQRFWQLPESQKWDPNLEVHVVITIEKNGSIRKSSIERKSGNLYFDKFVEQTLKNAAPLPLIPESFEASEIEVGLRFKPGELF